MNLGKEAHRKSASKCWIKEIIIASQISFQIFSFNNTINHFYLKLSIFVAILQVLKFEFQKLRILEIMNFHTWTLVNEITASNCLKFPKINHVEENNIVWYVLVWQPGRVLHTVNVLRFQTLVACQFGQSIKHTAQTQISCFWRNSLIRVFPVCYSDKNFCEFQPDYQHFLWKQCKKCSKF